MASSFGRFTDDVGNVRVSGGCLEFHNSDGTTRRTVLRHVRLSPAYDGGSKNALVQAKLTWQTIDAGLILHYQDPENFGVALLDWTSGSTVTPRYVEFKDGKKQATRASGTSFTLAASTTYTLKAVISADQNGAQTLKLYVDGTERLSTGTVDDAWSGGCVGLFRASSATTTTLQWDDFKCGLDNNADGDLDDAGDYVYASFDFNDPGGGVTWQQLSLSHDDNGNLTADGLYKYKYDAWNRLVGVWYNAGDMSVAGQRVATYAYDGLFRRTEKLVANQGVGVVYKSDAGGITGIQAGNRHEHYFWGGMGVSPVNWRLVETTDHASGDPYSYANSHVLDQTVYGTQYIDEPVCRDRNLDANTTCIETGAAGDARYFYHQDANYRVVMLTGEDGAVVERYAYTAYGEPTVYGGYNASAGDELGNTMLVSTVGNPFLHQGLFYDRETGTHQNRFRALDSTLGRFMQRDPMGYVDGLDLYEYLDSAPPHMVDPRGAQMRDDVAEKWKRFFDARREEKARKRKTPTKEGVIVVDAAHVPEKKGDASGKRLRDAANKRQKDLEGEVATRVIEVVRDSQNTPQGTVEATLEKVKDHSLDQIDLIDHGNEEGQQCGDWYLNKESLKVLCQKMKDGGTINLWGCEVAKDLSANGVLCQVVRACQDVGVNVTVCGCQKINKISDWNDRENCPDGCWKCRGPGDCKK